VEFDAIDAAHEPFESAVEEYRRHLWRHVLAAPTPHRAWAVRQSRTAASLTSRG